MGAAGLDAARSESLCCAMLWRYGTRGLGFLIPACHARGHLGAQGCTRQTGRMAGPLLSRTAAEELENFDMWRTLTGRPSSTVVSVGSISKHRRSIAESPRSHWGLADSCSRTPERGRHRLSPSPVCACFMPLSSQAGGSKKSRLSNAMLVVSVDVNRTKSKSVRSNGAGPEGGCHRTRPS